MCCKCVKCSWVYVGVIILALCVAFFHPNSVRAEQNNNSLSANLENIQLKDFIKFIASYTGRNIVFQEAKIPGVTVTIYSAGAMTEPELMAIFEQVLNSANLYTVARGNILYILNQTEAQNLDSSLKMPKSPPEELVTTVYKLNEDIQPAMAAQLLSKFSSKFGQVQPIPQAQAVLIRDRADQIRKMLQVLNNIQNIKPSWEIEVAAMEIARAGSAAEKLTDIYKKMLERGQVGEAPVVTPIEWNNSLLIAGTKEQIKMVRSILAQIDDVSEKATERELTVYRLMNAKADSAAQVLMALISGQTAQTTSVEGEMTGGDTTQDNGDLLVSADSSTNSVLVLTDPSFKPTIDDVIQQLDRPLDQVYIEALIMETSLSNAQNFGVEWISGGGSGQNYAGSIGYLQSGSSLLKYADPVIDGGAPDLSALPSGFSLGVLGNMVEYNGKYFPTIGALISYTKSVDDFNLLSAPQIMTLDNSEAEIFVGDSIPFQTGSQTTSGGSTQTAYEYRDVGIKLVITPYVNSKSGLIRLDVNQEYNQESGGELGLPTTRNRVTKTSVQLVDGSTMVISGLIENSQSRGQDAVPGLSQLPVLGWLFKNRSGSSTKRTLMVFISARIVRTLEQAESVSRGKMKRLKEERRKMEKTIQDEFGVVDENSKSESASELEPEAESERDAPEVREF